MLRQGAAVASVLLCFVCVLTHKPPSASELCGKDVMRRVSTLRGGPGLQSLDSRLYTPNQTDYQQNCPISSLKCFAAEVDVLTTEWEVGAELKLGKMLQSLATLLKTLRRVSESHCRPCEILQEENPEEFLHRLFSILQYVQARFCT